jgi:hypothetical protein
MSLTKKKTGRSSFRRIGCESVYRAASSLPSSMPEVVTEERFHRDNLSANGAYCPQFRLLGRPSDKQGSFWN